LHRIEISPVRLVIRGCTMRSWGILVRPTGLNHRPSDRLHRHDAFGCLGRERAKKVSDYKTSSALCTVPFDKPNVLAICLCDLPALLSFLICWRSPTWPFYPITRGLPSVFPSALALTSPAFVLAISVSLSFLANEAMTPIMMSRSIGI